MKVGYIRVSTPEQNPERQLEGFAVDKKFIDYSTGRLRERPEFDKMRSYVREGDFIYVHSMDRLARNVDHLRNIVKEFTSKGITVHFIKENLSFTGQDSPMNNLLLTMMGAFAELEIDMMKERQREGIAIARAKGIYGRPKKLLPEQKDEILMLIEKPHSVSFLAKQFGVSRQTIYKIRRKGFKNVMPKTAGIKNGS